MTKLKVFYWKSCFPSLSDEYNAPSHLHTFLLAGGCRKLRNEEFHQNCIHAKKKKKKVTVDWTPEMLAAMRPRTLNLPVISKNIKIKIHRTIILPDVSCGCETWSLTLKEWQSEGVAELGAEVGRYLGLEREEINQDWRKVHSEELHGLWRLWGNLRKKYTWETLT